MHRREITVRGYKRDDGMFDIEGHLHDTKDIDFNVASGQRKAGESLHSMWLRITIDRTLTIVDAEATTDAMPYVGHCDQIAPDYKKLIGLAIRPGFSGRVKELLGGTNGCTHITDLIGVVATTAFQTIAGQGMQAQGDKPFQLDRCHALALTAPAVARYYPQWYIGDAPYGSPPAEPENH
ncbi:MAG: DUF2889 domain-containing protein [Burkholderiales bacterium]|nr:DUF2889 domain-containing protein [Burkholderiales bacterium]